MADNKDWMRATTIASRALRSKIDIAAAGESLAHLPWLDTFANSEITTSIACYTAMGDEPPTMPLMKELSARGVRIALPIMRPERKLAWGWHGSPMQTNHFGISEPEEDSSIDLTSFWLLLIPALRAGLDGSRLGRGAGYYDRALAHVPPHESGGPLRVVIVFDDEVEDSVVHDALDQFIDVIATPQGFIQVK